MVGSAATSGGALLGLESGVKTNGAAADWARWRRHRIVPCIPASGAHLELALGQIGLELG